MQNGDDEMAVQYIQDLIDQASSRYRIGTRNLRSNRNIYTPAVLDRTGWENFYLSLPLDYDIKNDCVFDARKSTYRRIGDVGAGIPEPTTSESMRTGYYGPDSNSYVRPGHLRGKAMVSSHIPHRGAKNLLHYSRADPIDGALPLGNKDGKTYFVSTAHDDYKWHKEWKNLMPKERDQDGRKLYNGLNVAVRHPKIRREVTAKWNANYTPLAKLRQAFYWPVNPITNEALGGRMIYFDEAEKDYSDDKDGEELGNEDEGEQEQPILPCDLKKAKKVKEKSRIFCIPKDRLLAFADIPRVPDRSRPPYLCRYAYLDLRFPTPNFECWTDVPKPAKIPCSKCCEMENTYSTGFTCLTDGHTGCYCRPEGCRHRPDLRNNIERATCDCARRHGIISPCDNIVLKGGYYCSDCPCKSGNVYK